MTHEMNQLKNITKIKQNTAFEVNIHSLIAWMSRNVLLETGAIYASLKWLQRHSNPRTLSP